MTSTAESTAPPIWLEIVAALLVPAGTYGFVRIFAESSAILPIIGAALLSSATAVAARRARIPLLPAIVVSLVALVILLAARFAPSTLRFGIVPTMDTLDEFEALTRLGIEQFRELRAPVESTAPFVAASMGAAWLMAFLTDWGALRLRLAFEPVLPAGLLFIFASVLGSGERKVLTTVVFVSAVIAWAISQRTANLMERGVWLTMDRRRGPSGLARAGLGIAVVAMMAGIVVGPRLPGAEAEELYAWRDRTDPTRVVVSPYANIGSRLVTQTAVTMFTVESSRPAYWRLAGLDTYNADDGIWQTKGEFQPEDGGLPGTTARAGTTVTIEQQFQIEALSAIWLPAAFAPSNLTESTVPATWNADSAALTVNNDFNDSDGVTYSIESVLPLYTPDELNAASDFVPVDIAERYLDLPAGVTPRIASDAASITAGATTRYEQMLALQDFFRGFDYNVRLGDRGDDPIETFLDERVGFCQQFSGTFALMARALGAPARVAVGFTWGDQIAEGLYEVTGRHTHAWPEVWFDGLGWVAFEPTPGRGAPDAEYTNIEPTQDSLTSADLDAAPPINPAPSPFQPDLDSQLPEFDTGLNADTSPLTDTGGGISIPWQVYVVLGVIAAYIAAMLGTRELKRRRRRARAVTVREQVEASWADATDDLALGFDLVRSPAETRREFAQRAMRDRRVPDDELLVLSRAVTEARYRNEDEAAAAGRSDATAERARTASAAVSERVKERVAWQTRIGRQLDPRRLLAGGERIAIDSSAINQS